MELGDIRLYWDYVLVEIRRFPGSKVLNDEFEATQPRAEVGQILEVLKISICTTILMAMERRQPDQQVIFRCKNRIDAVRVRQ